MNNSLPSFPSKKIFILAGEASADHLGANLMTALQKLSPHPLIFSGVGGNGMLLKGLQPIFPMHDLSIMGLFTIIPSLKRIFKRLDKCTQVIKDQEPDCIILIDTQDFSYRLAKRIQNLGIPCILYCAPTVWAWRSGRTKQYKKVFTELLSLYPFEPAYFEGTGAQCHFVGHPLFERLPRFTSTQQGDFYKRYNLDPKRPIIILLPGSRRGEIKSLLPLFLECLERLHQERPDLQFVLPTLENLVPLAETYLQPSHRDLLTIITRTQDKYLALSLGQAAVAASGTISLELAYYNVPHLVTYRVSSLTAWVMKRLLKTPYANMLNIMGWHQDKENFIPIVPEFIQKNATADAITPILLDLLNPQSPLMQHQKEQFKFMLQKLQPSDRIFPSYIAAQRVIAYLSS